MKGENSVSQKPCHRLTGVTLDATLCLASAGFSFTYWRSRSIPPSVFKHPRLEWGLQLVGVLVLQWEPHWKGTATFFHPLPQLFLNLSSTQHFLYDADTLHPKAPRSGNLSSQDRCTRPDQDSQGLAACILRGSPCAGLFPKSHTRELSQDTQAEGRRAQDSGALGL